MDTFKSSIIGQSLAVDKVGAYLTCLLAAKRQDRVLLLRGGRMTGKSTLAKAAAQFLGRKFELVDGEKLSEFEDLLASIWKKVLK